MSPAARALALGAYALATFLAFPQPVGGHVLDLGWLLAWVAPAPLWLALRGLPPRRAAALGLLGGLLAHGLVLHWIFVVTVRYGHAPVAVGVVAPLLLALYVALFTGLFGGVAAWLAPRGPTAPLVLAALWTAAEHLRSFALTGFPWATLGYAQHENPALLAWAPYAGVYGLSFASALAAFALAEAAALRRRGALTAARAGGPGLALAVLLLAGGAALAAASGPPASGATRRVAVLQGNIPQGVKWSPRWADRTMRVYEDLTRRATGRGAAVVVWPETAVPGSLDADPRLRRRVAALARETGATLVVGGVGAERAPGAGPEAPLRLYDSAYLVAPDGRFLARYDKTHLVPFGEYLPFRALLGRFVRAVATGSAGRDVSAGPAPRALQLPLPPAARLGAGPSGAAGPSAGSEGADAARSGGVAREAAAVTVGVPICYELLFPDLVRRFVGDGARVLFGITNDAWYGRTGAPYQFLAMTALRSAETGAWTARAANTGVSAFIDGRGRVHERTGLFERGLLVRDVPLRPEAARDTFYVRHGDVFAGACWLGLGAAAVARVARGRRGRRAGAEEERG